jgi:putative Mg2+ transporter-C (MgtC) family protein
MDVPYADLEICLRLGLAVMGGAVVGWNRQRKRHPAGLRTMMLVSLGSAAFMVAGAAMATSNGVTSPVGDRSRVLQGIVGGIGFLGAGTIIRSYGEVKGVTTAAAIWVVAAIGSAFGLGLYVLGGASVGLTMLILWLSPLESAVFKHGQKARGMDRPKSPEEDGNNSGYG